MTLLTIQEAADFLRLTKRTLYQREDIPRVRYGHRVMYIKEDLERWVRACYEKRPSNEVRVEEAPLNGVDAPRCKVYHRNRLFVQVPKK
jgi:hypothetical protein